MRDKTKRERPKKTRQRETERERKKKAQSSRYGFLFCLKNTVYDFVLLNKRRVLLRI